MLQGHEPWYEGHLAAEPALHAGSVASCQATEHGSYPSVPRISAGTDACLGWVGFGPAPRPFVQGGVLFPASMQRHPSSGMRPECCISLTGTCIPAPAPVPNSSSSMPASLASSNGNASPSASLLAGTGSDPLVRSSISMRPSPWTPEVLPAVDARQAAGQAQVKLTRRIIKAATKRMRRDPQHRSLSAADIRQAVRAVLCKAALPGVCEGPPLGAGAFGIVRSAIVSVPVDGAPGPVEESESEEFAQHAAAMQQAYAAILQANGEAAGSRYKRVARKFTCMTAKEVLLHGAGPGVNELACAALVQAGYLPECALSAEVAYPHHVHVRAVESCKQALMEYMRPEDLQYRSEGEWAALDQPGLLVVMDYEELDYTLQQHIRNQLHWPRLPWEFNSGKLGPLLPSTPLGSHPVNAMEVLYVSIKSSRSVHTFHQQSKLLHGDLKPDNLFIKRYSLMELDQMRVTGSADIACHGVQRVVVGDQGGATLQAQPLDADWCFARGAEMGTEVYMRPERQARRYGWTLDAADAADDNCACEDVEAGDQYVADEEAGSVEAGDVVVGDGEAGDGEAGDEGGQGDAGKAGDSGPRVVAPNMDICMGDDVHSMVGVIIQAALGCSCGFVPDIADNMFLWYTLTKDHPATQALAAQLISKSAPFQREVDFSQADGEVLLVFLQGLCDQGPAGQVLMDVFRVLAHAKLATFDDLTPSKDGVNSYRRCTFNMGHLAQLLEDVQAKYSSLTDPAAQCVMVEHSRKGLLRPEPATLINFLARSLRHKEFFMGLVKHHPDVWCWLQQVPRDVWPEWLAGPEGRQLRASLRQQQQQWDAQQPAVHLLPSQLAADDAELECGSEEAADAAPECCSEDAASECDSEDATSQCGSEDAAPECGPQDDASERGSEDEASEDQEGTADLTSDHGSQDEADTQMAEEEYVSDNETSALLDDILSASNGGHNSANGGHNSANGGLEDVLSDLTFNCSDRSHVPKPESESKVLVCHDDKAILLQHDAAVISLACMSALPCEPTANNACLDLLALGSPRSSICHDASKVLSPMAVPSLEPVSSCASTEAGSVHDSVDCSVDHSVDLDITVPDLPTSSSQADSTPDSVDLSIPVPADPTNTSEVNSIHTSARLPVLANPRTDIGADNLTLTSHTVCSAAPRHAQDCEQAAFLDCSTKHLPPFCSKGTIPHSHHSDQLASSDHGKQELLHTSAGTTGCSSHDVSPHSHPTGQLSFSGQVNQEPLQSSGSTSSTTGCSSGASSYDGTSVTDNSSQGRCSIITPTSEDTEASEPDLSATKKKGWRSMLLPFSKQSSSTAAVVKEQAPPAADVKAHRHTWLFAKLGKNSGDATAAQLTATSQAPVSKDSKKRGLLVKFTTCGKAHDKGSLPVQDQPGAASTQRAAQGLKGLCTRLIEEAQRAGVGLTDMWTQVAHELQHEAQRMGLGVVEMWTQVDRFAYQASQELKGVLVCGAPQQA